ncbi:MAG TPA: LuxR C-terminal-related transcriptional regulator, partial [Actinomycetota bacterium]|nr:LuxR C-terminal-related transcriptional regulator [Actinomycetota bacterium]
VRDGLGEALAYLVDLLWEGRPVATRADELPRPLTEQEIAILKLMCDGASDRKIAGDLNISNRTVQRRLQDVSGVLGADSRAASAARAVALGLVKPFAE